MAAGGGEGTTLTVPRGLTTTTTTSSTLNEEEDSLASGLHKKLSLSGPAVGRHHHTANGGSSSNNSNSSSSKPVLIPVSQTHSQNVSDTESADGDLSSATSTSASTNTTGSEYELSDTGQAGSHATRNGRSRGARGSAVTEKEIWSGTMSSVVGLQKRGLRGLMEGRRIRERGKSTGQSGQPTNLQQQPSQAQQGSHGPDGRVGLGIA
jgi:hypothetical protein